MLNGFLSYAHDDHAQAQALWNHLRTSEGNDGARFWWDDANHGGQRWKKRIFDAIDKAEIFAVLVSNPLLTSDFVRDEEKPRIAARIAACGGLLVPILLSPCYFESEYADTLAVPLLKGRVKPISAFNPRSVGYDAAHRGILAAIKDHWPVTVGASP